MKLRFLALTFILSFVLSVQAQTYVDIPWREGTIFKDGKEQAGMIRLGGDLNAPWLNCTKVYFVPTEKWVEGKKPRKKAIETFKPKHIDGYATFTEDYEGNRVEMNFTTLEVMITGALRKKKGKAFLRLAEKGAIEVYSYVPKPTEKILTTKEQRNKDVQSALNRSTFYLKTGEGKLISAVDCKLVELLKDCPEVVEKIENEAYGFKPKDQRKKKKGLGKLLSNAAGDNGLENRIYQAIVDYNKCIQ